MNNSRHITAIILSGGKGLRFGSALPKQYLEICGKPVLAHTLQAFQKSCVTDIVIVAAPEYREICRNMAEHYGIDKVRAVTEGGAERYDSVLQGLRCITVQEDTDAVVLIHDGARPCIKPGIIDRIVEETVQNGAAIAGTPCTDTIKILDAEGCIAATTDRQLTWAAQTPQAFYYKDILEAYEKIIGIQASSRSDTAAGGQKITDDAMVYQMAFPDRKVKMVSAGIENIKITNASDLNRAASFLEAQEEKSRLNAEESLQHPGPGGESAGGEKPT